MSSLTDALKAFDQISDSNDEAVLPPADGAKHCVHWAPYSSAFDCPGLNPKEKADLEYNSCQVPFNLCYCHFYFESSPFVIKKTEYLYFHNLWTNIACYKAKRMSNI